MNEDCGEFPAVSVWRARWLEARELALTVIAGAMFAAIALVLILWEELEDWRDRRAGR